MIVRPESGSRSAPSRLSCMGAGWAARHGYYFAYLRVLVLLVLDVVLFVGIDSV